MEFVSELIRLANPLLPRTVKKIMIYKKYILKIALTFWVFNAINCYSPLDTNDELEDLSKNYVVFEFKGLVTSKKLSNYLELDSIIDINDTVFGTFKYDITINDKDSLSSKHGDYYNLDTICLFEIYINTAYLRSDSISPNLRIQVWDNDSIPVYGQPVDRFDVISYFNEEFYPSSVKPNCFEILMYDTSCSALESDTLPSELSPASSFKQGIYSVGRIFTTTSPQTPYLGLDFNILMWNKKDD